ARSRSRSRSSIHNNNIILSTVLGVTITSSTLCGRARDGQGRQARFGRCRRSQKKAKAQGSRRHPINHSRGDSDDSRGGVRGGAVEAARGRNAGPPADGHGEGKKAGQQAEKRSIK